MKNKQTAVDFLIQVLIAPCRGIPSDIIEQAKQMEKDQITTFTADWSIQYKYEDGKSIIAYYDETFGGNNDK